MKEASLLYEMITALSLREQEAPLPAGTAWIDDDR